MECMNGRACTHMWTYGNVTMGYGDVKGHHDRYIFPTLNRQGMRRVFQKMETGHAISNYKSM